MIEKLRRPYHLLKYVYCKYYRINQLVQNRRKMSRLPTPPGPPLNIHAMALPSKQLFIVPSNGIFCDTQYPSLFSVTMRRLLFHPVWHHHWKDHVWCHRLDRNIPNNRNSNQQRTRPPFRIWTNWKSTVSITVPHSDI